MLLRIKILYIRKKMKIFQKLHDYESDLLDESEHLRDDLYGLPYQSDLSVTPDYEGSVDANTKMNIMKNMAFYVMGKTMFNCWNNMTELPLYGYQRVDLSIKKPYIRPIEPSTEFRNLKFEGKSRGHMNPAQFCRDKLDIEASFIKFNIAPQSREVNNGPCNRLEKSILKNIRNKKCIGHVTTVYKAANDSEEADKFFKIVFYENRNKVELQCHMITDQDGSVVREVHLKDVEIMTGLRYLNVKTLQMMSNKDVKKHRVSLLNIEI